jgi:ATP-dependent Clp protease adaptor protein ClpS
MAAQISFSVHDPAQWEQQDTEILDDTMFNLIVWNDEVNTFDWVIQSLIEICHHSTEQAEQCALLIHFKGKYAVKKGDFINLRRMCEALIDRGINATVE